MNTISDIKAKLPELIEGVMVKDLKRHPDERGFFEEIIRVNDPFFKEGFGQLSRSYMHDGVIKAWHVHKTQVDWWFVFQGTMQVALFDMRENSKTKGALVYFEWNEKEDAVLKIPPQVAHGLKVVSSEAILTYVTSSVYNTEEEGRVEPNDPQLGFDWNTFAPLKQ